MRSRDTPNRFRTWVYRSWGTGIAVGAAIGLMLLPQGAAGDSGGAPSGGFVFWRKPAPPPPEPVPAAVEPVAEPAPDTSRAAGEVVAAAPADGAAPAAGALDALRAENERLQAQMAMLEQALASAHDEVDLLQAKLEAILAVPQPEDTDLTRLYRVQEGDTLYTIAQRSEIYDDGRLWKRIFEANRHALNDPKRLRPGQDLVIPR